MSDGEKRYAMRLHSYMRAVEHFRKILAYLNVLITQDADGNYSHAHLDICHAISRIDAHLNFLVEEIGGLPVKEMMINLPSGVAKEMNIYIDMSNEAIERLRVHNIFLTEN
jgi:hypothetical protein|tara:strand:+ start:178 stop:510 length:333 start_codon:yes stop_codon:yes gene_type:complete